MINYLNCTKRLFVALTTTTALAGSLSLVSCQDYDAIDESQLQEVLAQKDLQNTINEFSKNFITRYGEPDPNHDWGFKLFDLDAQTRGVVTNKNEWISVYHLLPPGMPDTWVDTNGVTHNDGNHWADNSGNSHWYGDKHSDSDVAGGDVTDEEIQYVSWWFRTHRYPTTIHTTWSDFFIHEVSSDYDRDVNGNVVNKAVILKKTGNNGTTYEVDGYETVDSRIDQLQALDIDGNWIHINNFNSGSSNGLYDCVSLPMENENPFKDLRNSNGDIVTTNKRLMDFYTSAGTSNFMAHYSSDSRDRDNYNGSNIWVLVHLHFTGKADENGVARVYDGYYLGFDLACYKENSGDYTLFEPDGYYSNWIVKLTPAKASPQPPFTRRIMCEDLGNTYDFDFDDVVFDVTYNVNNDTYNNWKNYGIIPTEGFDATIRLQAAGGTMPIFVGVNPEGQIKDSHEAHKLFGFDDYTIPINVDKNLGIAGVVNYNIKTNSLNPKDIGIYVYNTSKKQWYNLAETSAGAAEDNYNPPASTEKSIVPQRFAVPPTVLWLKETHQIEKGYPHFADWVAAATREQYSEDGTNPWFATDINASELVGGGNLSTIPNVQNINNTGIPGTTSDSQGFTHTLTALVNEKTWGSVTASGNGLDSKGYGVYSTKKSEQPVEVTVTAHPASGHTFSYWNINIPVPGNEQGSFYNKQYKTLTNPQLTFELSKEIVVFAVFE